MKDIYDDKSVRHQENITIINIYAPSNRASKYVK